MTDNKVQLNEEFQVALQNDDKQLIDIRNSTIQDVQSKYNCNRAEARKLIKFAHEQEEEDNSAYAPSSVEYLESLIDTGIRNELMGLLALQKELQGIVAKAEQPGEDKNQKWKRKAGASVTGAEAKMMLDDLFSRILAIKKTLAASRPKDSAGPAVTIDMGSMVGDIVRNIKDADA